MAEDNGNQNSNKIIPPSVREFTNTLAHYLATEENLEVFRNGTPEQKLERVLICSDMILEPEKNYILINSNLTFGEMFKQTKG